jgi:hypothetical protein
MRTDFFKVIVAAALFGTLLWTGTAFAAPNKGDQEPPATRVVITNLQPAQVLTVFQSASAFDPKLAVDRDPSQDSLQPTISGAPDGKPVEFSVPLGKVSVVWLWDEQSGYRFLANVAAGVQDSQIVLDASQAK